MTPILHASGSASGTVPKVCEMGVASSVFFPKRSRNSFSQFPEGGEGAGGGVETIVLARMGFSVFDTS